MVDLRSLLSVAFAFSFVGGVATDSVAANVSLEDTDTGVQVLFDGELFAEYRPNPEHMPAIWPIIGPSGHEMTRSYPLGPLRSGEESDHPHHLSMWISHESVGDVDFWHVPDRAHKGSGRGDGGGRIVHQRYLRRRTGDGTAVLATQNHWTGSDDQVHLIDERTIEFGELGAPNGTTARYIDTTMLLIAPAERDTVIGDRKDGFFAVRVAGAMKVTAGLGGRFTNDDGFIDGEAWGRHAAWVDYRGPLAGHGSDAEAPSGGVLIMSHPDAFRGRCRWHVREYGLFAANPFGEHQFPDAEPAQGAVVIPAGDRRILRFRTVFYADSPAHQQRINWVNEFAGTPLLASP